MKLGLNTPFITLLDAILLVVFAVITIFVNSNSMNVIIGVLILLVAIIGFFGALKSKRLFLLVFFAACAMLAIYQIVWIVTQIIGGNSPAVAFPVFVTLALLIGTGLGYKLWRMTPEAEAKSKDIEKGKEERIPEPPKPQVPKPEEPKSQDIKPQEPTTDVKTQAEIIKLTDKEFFPLLELDGCRLPVASGDSICIKLKEAPGRSRSVRSYFTYNSSSNMELKPSRGPIYGENEVWIKGRNFTNDVRVFFGLLEATIKESSPNLIIVEAPSLALFQDANITVPVTILEDNKRAVFRGLKYTYQQQSNNICVM